MANTKRRTPYPWATTKLVSGIYVVALLASMIFLVVEHYRYTEQDPPPNIQIWQNMAIAVILMSVVMASVAMYQLARAKAFSKLRAGGVAIITSLFVTYLLAMGFWAYTHFAYETSQDMDHTTQVLTQVSMYYVITATLAVLRFTGTYVIDLVFFPKK